MARRWLSRAVTGRTPATVRSAASRSGVRVSTTRPPDGQQHQEGDRASVAERALERRADGRAQPAARGAQILDRGVERRGAPEHVGEPGHRHHEQRGPDGDVGPGGGALVVAGGLGRRPAGDERDADRGEGERQAVAQPAEGVGGQVGEAATHGTAPAGVDAEAGDDRDREQQQAGDVVGVVAEHPRRRAQGA